MAKMFYTLEEAAERLGTDADRVKEMVAAGQLQQFRDRDKLMFKRDQIDAMASGGDRTSIEDSGAPLDLADSSAGTKMGSSGPIALADSGDTDAISLSDDTTAGRTAAGQTAGNTGHATGVSVFDADEVEPADPMAQTQVTRSHPEDEDIALESVGSGSGLLDLTRESDDTSLGAELLDEIYPGGESADSKLESAVGSSGAFESVLGGDTGVRTGLTGLGTAPAVTESGPMVGAVTTYSDADTVDPAWSGASAGLLLAALVGLILGLVIIAAGIAGNTGGIVSTLANIGGDGQYGMSSLILLGALLVVALVLGGIGFVVGKGAR